MTLKILTPVEAKVLLAIWELTQDATKLAFPEEIGRKLNLTSGYVRRVVFQINEEQPSKPITLVRDHNPRSRGRTRVGYLLSEDFVTSPQTATLLLELQKAYKNCSDSNQLLSRDTFERNYSGSHKIPKEAVRHAVENAIAVGYIEAQVLSDTYIKPRTRVLLERPYLELLARQLSKVKE